jgi:hypothetical protein
MLCLTYRQPEINLSCLREYLDSSHLLLISLKFRHLYGCHWTEMPGGTYQGSIEAYDLRCEDTLAARRSHLD